MVEFISYDGKWPNLCRGTLKIKVNGIFYSLKYAMCSGGSVWFDKDWCDHVESGPWTIDIDEKEYPELIPYVEEITKVVNENVPQGCCGGCI